jgi:hypothetical protein
MHPKFTASIASQSNSFKKTSYFVKAGDVIAVVNKIYRPL